CHGFAAEWRRWAFPRKNFPLFAERSSNAPRSVSSGSAYPAARSSRRTTSAKSFRERGGKRRSRRSMVESGRRLRNELEVAREHPLDLRVRAFDRAEIPLPCRDLRLRADDE